MTKESRRRRGSGARRSDRPTLVAPRQEVLDFAANLPIWQQHIVQCLFQSGSIRPDDLEAAFLSLLSAHGLLDGNPPHLNPLDSQRQVGDESPASVVLQSIGPVTNVNRLARNQVLPFATDGLTVIYGENASGKSGYVRLLKAASGVASSGERLLPDVLTQTPAVSSGAHIRLRTAKQSLDVEWRLGDVPIAYLRGLSVFDSAVAPVFSDSERTIEFVPPGLEILGRLADAMTVFASRLDSDGAATRAALPPLSIPSDQTTAGRIAIRLAEGSALPSEDDLRAVATWTHADEVALADVKGRIDLDPLRAAARSERLVLTSNTLAARLRDADAALGGDAWASLRQLRQESATARRLAIEVAEELARDDSVLPNVGSEPWRLMLQYAREYVSLASGSFDLAPDLPEARCPLCQQILGDDAKDRLRHFSEFLEGRAAAAAQDLEFKVSAVQASCTSVAVPSEHDLQVIAAAMEPILPDAVQDLSSAATAFGIARRRQEAIRDNRIDVHEETGIWPAALPSVFEAHAESLAALALAQRGLADPSTRAQLQLDCDELLARRALAQQLPAAQKRLQLLERLGRVAVARRTCDTTVVSRKNSQLREAFLTADFERRLRSEFSSLGLSHLPLRLNARTQAGHSLISIGIETPWAVRNREVLSDGELRALALACFFAEVNGMPGVPPVVLDDPVSSLDHERVGRVAQRIVTEARKGRQTIVFTHSLVLFHELWMQASEAQVPTSTHWLMTQLSVPGHVRAAERPWEAQDVKPRLNELERRLAAARRLPDHSTDQYRSAVAHFYTGLRETWERLVEEQLLGSVVQRYRLQVETRRLVSVEVTSDDYAKVYFAMSRVSEFAGHDRPLARQLAAPTSDAMSEDLRDIREYARDLKARQIRVERERRARHAPPTGQLELGA